MTTEEKIRWLAEQAGWKPYDHPCDDPECIWRGCFEMDGVVDQRDYPNSLDAIARDLLPILRERDMQYNLYWNGHDHGFTIWDADGAEIGSVQYPTEPATAAFEAIFEALHGETE